MFGINEKIVRDIWIGRTWVREIIHLDPSRASKARFLMLPGRLKGSKTADHTFCQAYHRPPYCLYGRRIDFTSETRSSTLLLTSREGPPDLSYSSSQPCPLAMIWPASTRSTTIGRTGKLLFCGSSELRNQAMSLFLPKNLDAFSFQPRFLFPNKPVQWCVHTAWKLL